ncbi:cutinase [Cyathus striatus]|nr:cutinase [Cyathus striatus]
MLLYFIIQAILSLTLIVISSPPSPNRVDLHGHQSCSDVYVYYARGSLEAPPIGDSLGPPFRDALQSALSASGKSLVFDGVDYPATFVGYITGGDPAGGATMVNNVTSTAVQCPNAKIVMSGYSQGAQLAHIAANRLSSTIQDRVIAVVTFGDPNRDSTLPGILQSRRATYCNKGDLVCYGIPIIVRPHLGYEPDIPSAAAFVAARV